MAGAKNAEAVRALIGALPPFQQVLDHVACEGLFAPPMIITNAESRSGVAEQARRGVKAPSSWSRSAGNPRAAGHGEFLGVRDEMVGNDHQKEGPGIRLMASSAVAAAKSRRYGPRMMGPRRRGRACSATPKRNSALVMIIGGANGLHRRRGRALAGTATAPRSGHELLWHFSL